MFNMLVSCIAFLIVVHAAIGKGDASGEFNTLQLFVPTIA